MAFKSLFSRKLQRYYLQPRIFVVNMQVRMYEKYILLDETVIAHCGRDAFRKAEQKIKERIEIKGVGYRVLGKVKPLEVKI